MANKKKPMGNTLGLRFEAAPKSKALAATSELPPVIGGRALLGATDEEASDSSTSTDQNVGGFRMPVLEVVDESRMSTARLEDPIGALLTAFPGTTVTEE